MCINIEQLAQGCYQKAARPGVEPASQTFEPLHDQVTQTAVIVAFEYSTRCYGTGNQRPYRCCHLANSVEYVAYVNLSLTRLDSDKARGSQTTPISFHPIL